MWLRVVHPTQLAAWEPRLNEFRDRSIEDILIAVVDRLKAFPEAIAAVVPRTRMQGCIVHLLRTSLDYVSD